MKKRNLIRKTLGLSQHVMAMYLGTSTATIKKYEQGLRSINSQAELKQFQLEAAYHQFIQQGIVTNDLPPDPGAAAQLESFMHRKLECRKRAGELKVQLDTMREDFRALSFQWQYFNGKLAAELNTADRLRLELMILYIARSLANCNKSCQVILQQKLDLLLAEMHLINDKLEQLSGK